MVPKAAKLASCRRTALAWISVMPRPDVADPVGDLAYGAHAPLPRSYCAQLGMK
jgi:hypothetical protein